MNLPPPPPPSEPKGTGEATPQPNLPKAPGKPLPSLPKPPAEVQAAQKPKEPRAPMPPKTRKLLGTSALGVMVVIFAGWLVSRIGQYPGGAEIKQQFTATWNKPGLKIDNLKIVQIGGSPKSWARYDLTITCELTEPLYQTLSDQDAKVIVGLDPVVQMQLDELRTMRKHPAISQLARQGSADPAGGDVLNRKFIRKVAEVGTTVHLVGQVTANKIGGGWRFDVGPVDAAANSPGGEPRSRLGSGYLDVSDPQQLSQVKAKLAEVPELHARFRQAKAAYIKARIDLLNPGSLFTGVARRGDETATIYLEIAAMPAGAQKITAVLRNDGGWCDTRGFQGDWHSDEDATKFTLKLSTYPGQQVRNGGPFLGFTDGWTFEGEIDERGHFSTKAGQWSVEFERVPDAEAAKVRDQAASEESLILAATKPGAALIGAVTNRTNGANEPLLIRFTKRDEKTGLLSGYFQSTARASLRRPFSGTLVTNKYRSDGHPLRLASLARERATVANDDEMLGINDDLRVDLKVEAEQISGEAGRYEYRFTQATSEQLAEVDARQKERLSRFAAIFRPGAVYNGTARHQDGFVGRLLLRIQRVDELEHTVTFSIDSRDQPGLRHQFSGAFDDDLGTVQGRSTGQGTYNKSGLRRVPFLSEDNQFIFRLRLSDDGLTGILANQWNSVLRDWQFEFLLEPGALPVAATPPAGAAELPTADGAYVLRNDVWVPLPRNNGRAVAALGAQTKEIVGGFLKALQGKNQEPGESKLAELIFDGAEEIPTVPSRDVTVLFVGSTAAPPERLNQYPELANYPEVEMAPTYVTPEGSRKSDLVRIVPGIAGFGKRRVAANLGKVDERRHLLHCPGDLGVGTYAISAGEQAYELRLQN